MHVLTSPNAISFYILPVSRDRLQLKDEGSLDFPYLLYH